MSGGGPHHPVLVEEILERLAVREGMTVLDATVGTGGHAEAVLERSSPGGRLIGIDRDSTALAAARSRLVRFGERVRLRHSRFSALDRVLREEGVAAVDAVLFDLGASSPQFDSPERGFSFSGDGPLDMRMDANEAVPTAADLLHDLGESELADLIFRLGEDRHARRIARAIVRTRERSPLRRTLALAETIAAAVPGRGRIHPATRTFQALRIAVNDEVGELRAALPLAVAVLAPGGRLAVVSFHSLEDREVKRFLRSEERAGRLRALTRKPVQPSRIEVERNRRSRSARLRAAERIAA